MEITAAAEKVELSLSLEGTKVSELSKPPSKEGAPKDGAAKEVAAKAEAPKPASVPPEIAVFVNGTATAPTLVSAAERPALPPPPPRVSAVTVAAKAAPQPRPEEIPAVATPTPPTRRVIRIFGLEEGVREIELPATK
jgi:hypothetical protein